MPLHRRRTQDRSLLRACSRWSWITSTSARVHLTRAGLVFPPTDLLFIHRLLAYVSVQTRVCGGRFSGLRVPSVPSNDQRFAQTDKLKKRDELNDHVEENGVRHSARGDVASRHKSNRLFWRSDLAACHLQRTFVRTDRLGSQWKTETPYLVQRQRQNMLSCCSQYSALHWKQID